MTNIEKMILSNSLRIGEEVIVIKPGSDNFDRIGEVSKISKYSEVKISVHFDGDTYRYSPTELELA